MLQIYEDIIQFLNTNGLTSSKNLGVHFNLSSRTIKKYIADINTQVPDLIIPTKKGYVLNESITYCKDDDAINKIPQTKTERINYMIFYLFENPSFNIDDLSEKIFVSNVTINRDLKTLAELCKRFNLKLEIKKGNVTISGEEKDKRRLINHSYCDEYENTGLDVKRIQELFPLYDIALIKTIIINTCAKYHYIINGYSLNMIILDVVIGMERIKQSNYSENYYVSRDFMYHEMLLSEEIIKQLEDNFDITYSNTEIRAFTILLFSHLLKIDYKDIKVEDLISVVGKDTYELSKKIVNNVQNYVFKNCTEDFFIRFTFHLSNLILRLQTNQINTNTLTSTIKSSCPYLFDCAVNISYIIKENTGYTINDDEIAYIAIHIGSLLEQEENTCLNCMLVIPNYYDFTNQLKDKIISAFNGKIQITHTVSEPDENVERICDIIITTLKTSSPKAVTISYALNTNDINLIENKINYIRQIKEKEKLTNNLLAITKPNYFHVNCKYISKQDLIKMMADEFATNSITDDNYVNEILERERMSSTVFGKVAVPHSMRMSAHKTMINICLFKNPVSWDNKQVNIVLLFAVSKSDSILFRNIFDNLIIMLSEEENLEKVLRSNDFNDFVKNILSLPNL